MVDEAHRSHSSALHANLLQALPNCARIGFTGTPIIMGAKKRTHDIFGEFIDRYTIKESEADGATVPILYEGRTAEGAVADGRDLDQLFEDLFDENDTATSSKRSSASTPPAGPSSKHRSSSRPRRGTCSGTTSRTSCRTASRPRWSPTAVGPRFGTRKHFPLARDELVVEAQALDEDTRALDDLGLKAKPAKVRAAVHAWRYLDRLERLEFAAIISGENNDPPDWREWTEAGKTEARIARFKKPLWSTRTYRRLTRSRSSS